MKTTYRVLGMMSGTSLDGLDIAYCFFELKDEKWHFELQLAETISYSEDWQEKLNRAMELNALQLGLLDQEYGTWLGKQAAAFIQKHGVDPQMVASHGHTVFHQPDRGLTLQIGSGQHLALEAKLPVICDFRSLDVALGGQGAPLVPVGDRLLFGDYGFCLNLGGISNISFEKNGERRAYDIGAANMLLNFLASQLGKTYDKDGREAATGNFNEALFQQLNQPEYFRQAFPKSLGREWFDEQCAPILNECKIPVADQLHTACHHIAYQVDQNVRQFLEDDRPKKMLITGGGAKNSFLMNCFRQYLPAQVEIDIPNENLIEYKEAIVFALLGVLRSRGEVNTLHTVTGASRSESGGLVFYPANVGMALPDSRLMAF